MRWYRNELGWQQMIWVYTTALLAVEAISAYVNPLLGITFHALLLLILVNHFVIREQDFARGLLPALTLIPLLRILSLAVLTAYIPVLYLYILVAIPLAIAMVLVARLQNLSWATIGLRKTAWLPQLGIALSGLPLGFGGFLVLRPAPLLNQFTVHEFVIASVILMVCAGGIEEILFRGLLYQSAKPLLGVWAIIYSSAVYTITYIDWLSVNYLLMAALLGLYFGWCVRRTGSLWGVMLAHGILNIGMLLVWPLI
jgi:membrane protease YdiL (CAAX protease family)